MIFEDKQITLKDGRTAILKTPCIEDAEKMLNYIKKACGETDFLARFPEEWDRVSVESEEKWVKNLRESQSTLAITCYIDGEVAGNCEINFRGGMKTAHRATVAIAILKEFWNLGIGSAMFTEMIAFAQASPTTEIMELEFVEGNSRAKALYEKFGFVVVGFRPNAFKLKGGDDVGRILHAKGAATRIVAAFLLKIIDIQGILCYNIRCNETVRNRIYEHSHNYARRH